MVISGNPDEANMKIQLKLRTNFGFFKNPGNKYCRNECKFSQCETTENWVFQRAG